MRVRGMMNRNLLASLFVCCACVQVLAGGHDVPVAQSKFDKDIGHVDMDKQPCGFWDRLFSRCPSSSPDMQTMAKGETVVINGESNGRAGPSKLARRNVAGRFNEINCQGSISILLDPKGEEGKVHANNSGVSLSDQGGVLELTGEHGKPSYDVVISGRDLVARIRKVNLNDRCSLHGENLEQHSWQLNSTTKGDITLRGMFKHCVVTQTGDNRLDMFWVGADDVDVVTRAGVMRLAGSVDHARIRSSGQSQVLVNQLRAKNAWLHASENAYVELFGSKRLVVFSDGDAQVLADGVPVMQNELSSDRSMFVIDD